MKKRLFSIEKVCIFTEIGTSAHASERLTNDYGRTIDPNRNHNVTVRYNEGVIIDA